MPSDGLGQLILQCRPVGHAGRAANLLRALVGNEGALSLHAEHLQGVFLRVEIHPEGHKFRELGLSGQFGQDRLLRLADRNTKAQSLRRGSEFRLSGLPRTRRA